MITIQNKRGCCGCQACVQRCPEHCISLQLDNEGFLYPRVDQGQCVDCHLCEKVCPVINQSGFRKPLAVYAVKNPNELIRKESSSGGVFTILAEKTIKDGGVVFGAKWDKDWYLVHDYTQTIDGIKDFRGSKYLQSDINGSFIKVEDFLKEGRQVLFSGTPCQIAGLKKFLRKDYDNLLLVDFICHGVPSPGVFRQYLKEVIDNVSSGINNNQVAYREDSGNPGIDTHTIRGINFRDKSEGWKNYRFKITFDSEAFGGVSPLPVDEGVFFRESNTIRIEQKNGCLEVSNDHKNNSFMRGFLKDIYLRPSCYSCPVRNLKSGSDICLGDFWKIHTLLPDFDDDRGVSAIMVNTQKGKEVLFSTGVCLYETGYEDLLSRNPSIEHIPEMHFRRKQFFLKRNKGVHKAIINCLSPSFLSRVKRKIAMAIMK